MNRRNYFTGYYTMTEAYRPGTPPPPRDLFPDPGERDPDPPPASFFATDQAPHSPFYVPGRHAVIRSVFMHRDDVTGSPTLVIWDHPKLRQFFIGQPDTSGHIGLTGLAWFLRRGFRISATGSGFWTISYDIIT